MNETLRSYLDGRISAQVAVAHFLFVGMHSAEIEAALDEAARDGGAADARLEPVRALLAGREGQLDALSAHVRANVTDHHAHGATPAEGIARIAGFFDRAVTVSPEASVALYSLGDPAILAAATREVVAWLGEQSLLGRERDVLDLGCGIGRVAEALAPHCRHVLGLDVSGGMIAEARRRHAGTPNLTFEQTDGQGFGMLADASLDLILAVDSFPYVIQLGAETVAAHLQGARRVLRPGGAIVLLNVSYEDEHDDAGLVTDWAERYGFELGVAGARPFQLWDGSASVLIPAITVTDTSPRPKTRAATRYTAPATTPTTTT